MNENKQLYKVTLNAQLKIKNYEVGKVQKVEESNTLLENQYFFISSNLNDGTMASLIAIPSDGKQNTRRVHKSEIELLIKSFEKKFNCRFRFFAKNQYLKQEGRYVARFDDDMIIINVADYNMFMDEPYDIAVYFINKTLSDIKIKQDEENAYDDL